LTFVIRGNNDFEKLLREQLGKWDARITENTINWTRDGNVEFDFVVLRMEEIKYSEIKKFADENESIISFSYSPIRTHTQ
jgi:hypothetical protein